jgi:glycosyltransferase involved in cell wall biosynthesis
MKIVLVTGSYPPQVCGVGDYARNLLEAGQPGHWRLYTSSNWRLSSLPSHIRAIDRLQPDAVVLQYPTQGYGWSLVPHMIGIHYSLKRRVKFAIALHEFSQLSPKARGALWILAAFTRSAVFTSKYEAELAAAVLPRLRSRSTVIPIKYNIEPSTTINSLCARTRGVCYFGQIRPNKGVEQFVEVCRELLRRDPTIPVCIAGQVPTGYEDYLAALREDIKDTSMTVIENMPADEVARFLNDCKVAYLPFPDGVSERRGSLLAALSNGLAVVAHEGRFSSPELKKAFVEAGPDPSSAILEVLRCDAVEYAQMQADGLRYLKENVPASWGDVARRYEDFLAQA